MDALVAQIQALSGSPSDLSSLQATLKLQQTDALLRAHAGALLTAVASLDMEAHSLGCLYLLEAKGRTSAAQQQQGGNREFLLAAARFLPAAAPEQVRLAPDKFVSLCHQVRVHAIALRQPKLGVLPLVAAVGKLCPTPEHVCPVHADAYQLMLLSKTYAAGQPLLSADMLVADPNATAVTPADVLLACYYGGLVETGRRQYAKALELFLSALTAPTMVLSAITLACLKKWLLVGLLHTGQAPCLPRWAPGVVSRALRSECQPYQELARLCGQEGKGAGDLAAYARSKQQEFEQDGNAGLVRLVVEGARQRRIAALTRTYATLSLADMASKVELGSPQEAELAVLRCIEGGAVRAAISERQGMVLFRAQQQALRDNVPSSGKMTERVDGLIKHSVALAEKLAAADHMVCRDRSYVARADLRSLGGSRPGQKAPAAGAAAAEQGEPMALGQDGGSGSEADLLQPTLS